MSVIYDVTDLGHPMGMPAAWPRVTGINGAGWIIGDFFASGPPAWSWPFAWHASTGLIELPARAALPAHQHCLTAGINQGGSVIGVFGGPPLLRPFRWDPHTSNGTTGTASALTLPAGATEHHVTAINASGHVLGGVTAGTRQGPVLWTTPTQPAWIWPEGDRRFNGEADLNDHGQVVGSLFQQSRVQPFLWQPQSQGSTSGVVHDLTDASTAADGGSATAINRHGQIVGATQSFTGLLWRWKPSSPNAPDGQAKTSGLTGKQAHPQSINVVGTAVGFATGGGQRAQIFWPYPSDLNDWIVPGTGWELVDAVAINDAGWIAGTGTLAGARRAFLLRPTVWKQQQLAFLRYVVGVVGGIRLDAGGWIFPPRGGPVPVPPWVGRIWERSSATTREALRTMALRDAQQLVKDAAANARLIELVPELGRDTRLG